MEENSTQKLSAIFTEACKWISPGPYKDAAYRLQNKGINLYVIFDIELIFLSRYLSLNDDDERSFDVIIFILYNRYLQEILCYTVKV